MIRCRKLCRSAAQRAGGEDRLMMEKVTLMCPCLFGLESVLSFEVKKLGGENIVVTDGRVTFDGDLSLSLIHI